MKKRNLFLFFIGLVLFILPVYADSLESVRVIKFWDSTDDLVVEQSSGEQLLIQHHKACSSMNTEFPIQLVWEDEKVERLMVAANEICDVYDFGPYSSDLRILERILPINALSREHLAKIEWQGDIYEIDYGEGCENLREYVEETAYLYTPNTSLQGATLYLPKARGRCEIQSATLLEENTETALLSPIKNLKYKAENNQVYFSWDAFPEDEIWLTLVTYSKHPMDPASYELTQLPNLKRTKANVLRILRLVNDQTYYFYLAASDAEGNISQWKELEITPKKTIRTIINHPDPEKFEIKVEETDTAYILTWPDKAEHSRRYLIQFFVNGKRKIFKTIPVEKPELRIEKETGWGTSHFRLTVRSIPKKPIGLRYFDSIFWRAD